MFIYDDLYSEADNSSSPLKIIKSKIHIFYKIIKNRIVYKIIKFNLNITYMSFHQKK